MLSKQVRLLALNAWAGGLLAQQPSAPDAASNVEKFTQLAFKYGPFAFAILFGLATWWLISQARAAAAGEKPEERRQAKYLWRATVIAGITCIVFAALGTRYWWASESVHFFSGKIKDLKTYEDVDVDEFYLKKETRPIIGAAPPTYYLHFVAVQARPFVAGQRFEIAYSKRDSTKRQILEIIYEGETDPSYRLEYNDLDVPLRIVKIPAQANTSPEKKSALNPFLAYGQAIPAMIPVMLTFNQSARPGGLTPKQADSQLIMLLQDPRTGVGAKIDALDRLRGMDPTELKAYAETITDREPFALTLIELSRHSDKQLASIAKAVVDKSGAEAAVARQLGSPKSEVRASAEQSLYRMGPERAERILKAAPQSPQTQRIQEQVRSGEKQQILAPVGSEGGDRYYVKANWDPKDKKTSDCLTALFNKELISSRTLLQEQKMMSGRSERLVYWYTKDWALSMAEKIKACGGKASFPLPGK